MKLEMIDYYLSYGDKTILSGINFSFNSGNINLIVGKSGCGKSSLLASIAGFHDEVKGTILLDEKEYVPDGNFALAFQNPENLFFNSTDGEEISYALLNLDIKKEEAMEISKDWMKKWDLNSEIYFDKNPMELSGGEKRRVALAACTVFKPPIIMLDEPLAGLDFKKQLKIAHFVEEVAKNSCVIIVTHEPEIFLRPTTNILYIRDGGLGERYLGKEFYLKSSKDEEFYPLPKWFQNNRLFSD